MKRKIYLAGPDVFRQNAEARGLELRALAQKHGFEGLWPLDNPVYSVVGEEPNWRAIAQQTYFGNLGMLERADAVLANLEPFRGPGMDQGTAWEIGFAIARRLPVFAYTVDARTYAARVWPHYKTQPPVGEKLIHEKDGMLIENFGLEENLMIACSIESLHTGPLGALQAAKCYFAERANG